MTLGCPQEATFGCQGSPEALRSRLTAHDEISNVEV